MATGVLISRVAKEGRCERSVEFSSFSCLSWPFCLAGRTQDKSKSFNKRPLPSVVARTVARAATKRTGRGRVGGARELNACSFVTVHR